MSRGYLVTCAGDKRITCPLQSRAEPVPPDTQNAEVEYTGRPGWCAVPEPGGQAGEVEDRGNRGQNPKETHASPPACVLADVRHHLPRIGHRLRTHATRHE